MHFQDIGHSGEACDRRDVADEIETELVVECGIGRVRGRDQEERVAVGGVRARPPR